MLRSVAQLLLVSAVFFLAGFSDRADAQPLTWSGSLKSLNMTGQGTPDGFAPDYTLSGNAARLETSWQPRSSWQFHAALDYQYLWSDTPDLLFRPSPNINRVIDLEKTETHGKDAASTLQVDRLNLQWREGPIDLTFGRQAIGFGRILINSPLDVIAPFAPDAIDTDVRSGIDALHTIFNYGVDGQLGAVIVWGEENRDNSYLGTWSDNTRGLDLLLIGGRLRGRNMVGGGIAGSLGTLGLKGEISVHDGRDQDKPGGDLHDTFAIAAIEAWYRFDNGLSLISQYLYNGPGVDNPQDYPRVLASAPLQQGLSHLLGRDYLILAPAYDLHPLAALQGLLIYNLHDESALLRPTLDLSLADNIALQLFWTWNLGSSPAINPVNGSLVPRSEFGLRGDSGGLFLKWFF